MLWGATKAQDTRPAVGARVVDISVEVKPWKHQDCLTEGIRSLYTDSLLCDVTLVAGGKSFPAHKAALATYPALRDRLHTAVTDAAAAEAVAAATAAAASALPESGAAEAAPVPPAPLTAEPAADTTESAGPPPAQTADAAAPPVAPTESPREEVAHVETQSEAIVPAAPAPPCGLEMHFPDISNPEAIEIMLAHIYGVDMGEATNYTPSNDETNKDVLRLASQLQIPSLKDFATHWMAAGLNSTNAVQRLSTCQEFALHDLFEAAAESLASDAFALCQVSEDVSILKHPRLLQKLLIRFAALYPKSKRERALDTAEEQRPNKRSKACPQEGGA